MGTFIVFVILTFVGAEAAWMEACENGKSQASRCDTYQVESKS